MANDTELIGLLAAEIRDATETFNAGTGLEESLPTAADLARKLKLRLETVKKKLRLLKEAHLIQPVTVGPKRYRFNHWALKDMEEGNAFYELFCDPDSPFFIPNHHHV